MRVVSTVCLLGLVACASSGSGSSGNGSAPAPDRTVRVIGATSSTNITMSGADVSNAHTFAGTVDQVWRALPIVFDSLGIPVQALDPVKHTIGASSFLARHKLKNVALSRYVDCGNTQMGPAADDYDVMLTVLADVHPARGGAGTTVSTTVEALARPANYAQDYSRCSSKGSLERKLFEFLDARLAR